MPCPVRVTECGVSVISQPLLWRHSENPGSPDKQCTAFINKTCLHRPYSCFFPPSVLTQRVTAVSRSKLLMGRWSGRTLAIETRSSTSATQDSSWSAPRCESASRTTAGRDFSQCASVSNAQLPPGLHVDQCWVSLWPIIKNTFFFCWGCISRNSWLIAHPLNAWRQGACVRNF